MSEEKDWLEQQVQQEQYRAAPVEAARPAGSEMAILAFTAFCGLILVASVILYAFFFFTRPELSGAADTGLFTGIVGPLVLWFGVLRYLPEKVSISGCRHPVTAVVSEILLSEGTSGRSGTKYTIYTPVLAYELDGRKIEVRHRGENRDKDKYQPGQQINMLVAPGEPAKYRIKGESEPVLLINLLYVLAGAPMTGYAVWFWVQMLMGMV